MSRAPRGLRPVLTHLAHLTDDTGIFEHATGLIPNRRHGYTAEDAARALVVTTRWARPSSEASRMTEVYLSFLERAIVDGVLRNRLTSDKTWGGPWSADAHGRAIWGLGITAAEAVETSTSDRAVRALQRLRPLRDPSIRPWVYAGLGAAALLVREPGDPYGETLADSVMDMLPEIGHGSWIWPETRLAYDNARLPECMIALGMARHRPALVDDGLRLLRWLIEVELEGDHFSFTPVGGRGPEDASPAFDQQPLEATAMLDATLAAWSATADPVWLGHAAKAASWFLGLNDVGVPVYDARSGAGHDGLTSDGVSENAGAESTISALWALQRAHASNLDESVEDGLLLDDSSSDGLISGPVGDVDPAIAERVGALDEDDVVDFSMALPGQLWDQDRLGNDGHHSGGRRIEQTHSGVIDGIGASLVIEEDEPTLGGDRWGAGSDTGPVRRGPDDGVLGNGRHVHIPVAGIGAQQIVEGVKDRQLDIVIRPMDEGDPAIGEVEDDRILVGYVRRADDTARITIELDPALFEDDPMDSDSPHQVGFGVRQIGVGHEELGDPVGIDHSLHPGVLVGPHTEFGTAGQHVLEVVGDAIAAGEHEHIGAIIQKAGTYTGIADEPLPHATSEQMEPVVLVQEPRIEDRAIARNGSRLDDRPGRQPGNGGVRHRSHVAHCWWGPLVFVPIN